MTADRATYRQLVADVAARAKEKLPQAVNGRIEKAVTLVLQGDVEPPAADGSITVHSATDATRRYVLHGTGCTCADFERRQAPEGWCAHRIAAGIAKRVAELIPVVPETVIGIPVTPQPLPEAPASLNVKVLVQGHEVLVTLRGEAEAPLFDRLHTLLQRSDVQPLPKPAPKAGSWQRRR